MFEDDYPDLMKQALVVNGMRKSFLKSRRFSTME